MIVPPYVSATSCGYVPRLADMLAHYGGDSASDTDTGTDCDGPGAAPAAAAPAAAAGSSDASSDADGGTGDSADDGVAAAAATPEVDESEIESPAGAAADEPIPTWTLAELIDHRIPFKIAVQVERSLARVRVGGGSASSSSAPIGHVRVADAGEGFPVGTQTENLHTPTRIEQAHTRHTTGRHPESGQ